MYHRGSKWLFFAVIFRALWSALVWSLSKDRWQVTIACTCLVLAGVLVTVPIYLFIKTLDLIARWQLFTVLLAAVTVSSIGISFLYSYSVDRSKVAWLKTREMEADREMERARLTYGVAAGAQSKALFEKFQLFRDETRGDFIDTGQRPPVLPAPRVTITDAIANSDTLREPQQIAELRESTSID